MNGEITIKREIDGEKTDIHISVSSPDELQKVLEICENKPRKKFFGLF